MFKLHTHGSRATRESATIAPLPGARVRDESGMSLIELLAAMTVLAIALLALLAGFGSAVVSLRASSLKTTASALADGQMELYRSLPYASVGLDSVTVAAIGDSTNAAYNATYATNPVLDGLYTTDPVTGAQTQLPSGTVNDVQIVGCGSAPQCLPVQTVTGPDHRTYRVDTYIRDLDDPAYSTAISWSERVVTVIVRNASLSGMPEILRLTSAIDHGPTT